MLHDHYIYRKTQLIYLLLLTGLRHQALPQQVTKQWNQNAQPQQQVPHQQWIPPHSFANMSHPQSIVQTPQQQQQQPQQPMGSPHYPSTRITPISQSSPHHTYAAPQHSMPHVVNQMPPHPVQQPHIMQHGQTAPQQFAHSLPSQQAQPHPQILPGNVPNRQSYPQQATPQHQQQVPAGINVGHLQQPQSQPVPQPPSSAPSAQPVVDQTPPLKPQSVATPSPVRVPQSNFQPTSLSQPSPQHQAPKPGSTPPQPQTQPQPQPPPSQPPQLPQPHGSPQILHPAKLTRQWSGSTASSLDDILSSSPENVRESTIPDSVLTPQVLTPQEIQLQKEEAMKNNAIKQALKQDPYQDKETLDKFVIEVEKFEKMVDGICKPTLNGPSPLDSIWKVIKKKVI